EQVIHLNRAAGQILEIDPETSIGKPIQEVVRCTELQQFIRHILDDGTRREQDIILEHEQPIQLNINGSALMNSRPAALGALVVLHDVTRLRRLETIRRDFVANVSHELKTPLASIKEGTGLLRDGVVGPLTPHQSEVLFILDSNCRKLQRLIQNILDFNMAKAREQPVQFGPVQLDRLVAEVVDEHRTILLARNIHLETVLPSLTVIAHPEQLKAVIDNLLGNAVKFTPDNGSIRILLSKNERLAQLQVQDSGPGISEEDRPHVFLPFFQGKQKNYSSVKGSGLGLAISKEYLENFGGSLRLIPAPPNQGAHFLATIPLASPEF
ncbi:MAG: PAS domain-containing protein, partial [Clostridia bacterium]|nr:PAS domain-containing protein [Clostridia bacterium]